MNYHGSPFSCLLQWKMGGRWIIRLYRIKQYSGLQIQILDDSTDLDIGYIEKWYEKRKPRCWGYFIELRGSALKQELCCMDWSVQEGNDAILMQTSDRSRFSDSNDAVLSFLPLDKAAVQVRVGYSNRIKTCLPGCKIAVKCPFSNRQQAKVYTTIVDPV